MTAWLESMNFAWAAPEQTLRKCDTLCVRHDVCQDGQHDSHSAVLPTADVLSKSHQLQSASPACSAPLSDMSEGIAS